MSRMNDRITTMSQGARLTMGAALLAIGIAGGAGAASLTKPPIEMAPTVITPIAKLGNMTGIVTIKGRVTEAYGDRFVVADRSGKTMIDAGPESSSTLPVGSMVAIQGRYRDGQLRASFLVGPTGTVDVLGPGGRGPRPGPRDDRGPDRGRMMPPPGAVAPPVCPSEPDAGQRP